MNDIRKHHVSPGIYYRETHPQQTYGRHFYGSSAVNPNVRAIKAGKPQITLIEEDGGGGEPTCVETSSYTISDCCLCSLNGNKLIMDSNGGEVQFTVENGRGYDSTVGWDATSATITIKYECVVKHEDCTVDDPVEGTDTVQVTFEANDSLQPRIVSGSTTWKNYTIDYEILQEGKIEN